MIGERVNGGMYADYPLLYPSAQVSGDLQFNNDFRMLYSTILDDFIGIAPEPIVNGSFERFPGMFAAVGA